MTRIVALVFGVLALSGCASASPKKPTTYWAFQLRHGSDLVAMQWAPSQAACWRPMADTLMKFAAAKTQGFSVYDCRPILVSQSSAETANLWAWTIVGWEGYGGAAPTRDLCERARTGSAVLTVKGPCVPVAATWQPSGPPRWSVLVVRVWLASGGRRVEPLTVPTQASYATREECQTALNDQLDTITHANPLTTTRIQDTIQWRTFEPDVDVSYECVHQ